MQDPRLRVNSGACMYVCMYVLHGYWDMFVNILIESKKRFQRLNKKLQIHFAAFNKNNYKKKSPVTVPVTTVFLAILCSQSL